MATPKCGFIQHQGKRIYLIDIADCEPAQVRDAIGQVARDVRSQPPKSVMTLLWVKGVKLEQKMNEELKDLAAGNAPYVKASAIAGLSLLQRVVLNTVKIFTRRTFHLFETLDEAKAFLTSLP